jgi:hypothetical protein
VDGLTDDESEFSYPRSNLIVSSRGFSVDVGARSAIRYEESGKVLEIFAEWLVGPEPEVALRRRDVRAWDGHEGDVAESDRIRIVENIRRAFAFKGWTLVIED